MAWACGWTKVLEDGDRDSTYWRVRFTNPLLDRPKTCLCLDDVHGSGSPYSASPLDPRSHDLRSRDDLLSAHIFLEHDGDLDHSIWLLEVFEDCYDCTFRGD